MIVDFTITNFRSIREQQTFSLLAESASNHLSGNVVRPDKGKIGVLRSAGVYGANASGKSNLLLAFWALRYLVCHSGDLKDGDSIPCYEPYLLSESTKNAPIEFEIELFSKDCLRYIYNVSFDSKRIISESLDFYPSKNKANIFKRDDGNTWEEVTFGSLYKGGRKRLAFFDNNTYISKAGNSADAPEMIRSIFNYFRSDIFHLHADERVQMPLWRENTSLVNSVAAILSKVDTGIYGIGFRDIDTSKIEFPNGTPEHIRKKIIESERKETFFLHKGENGIKAEFSEDIESAGTRKLFNILPLLIDAITDGGTLILDELDNSFHPHIAELVIKLFNNPDVNRKNAQLIFSTHNVNLMSHDLLRRDQIWLTEKKDGETTFSSLDDFDKSIVKMDSPFRKWYVEGRFGAIPSIDIISISKLIIDRIADA